MKQWKNNKLNNKYIIDCGRRVSQWVAFDILFFAWISYTKVVVRNSHLLYVCFLVVFVLKHLTFFVNFSGVENFSPIILGFWIIILNILFYIDNSVLKVCVAKIFCFKSYKISRIRSELWRKYIAISKI